MEASESRDKAVSGPMPPPAPTLTVAAVARRLGVAPPTLRTWDRRYGLGPSAHTAGAHRRYSPGDVARLMVMRRLTLEGVSPADAAKIAIATPVSDSGQPMLTPADGYDLSDLPGFGDLGGDAGDGRGDGFGAAPADDFSSPAGLLGDSAALGADVLRAELQQSDILDLSGVTQSGAELTQGELTQGERSPGELTRTERARRDDADLMDDAADLFSDTDLIAARQA
jgi:DNA-binding transcriptional MerR regulator